MRVNWKCTFCILEQLLCLSFQANRLYKSKDTWQYTFCTSKEKMPHFRLTCVAHQPLPQVFLRRKWKGRCHSVMGIPIPKILVIWASTSHITLAIWVRVTGDAHITRVWEWGCPYHCDSAKGKDLGKRLVCAKEGKKEKAASHLTSPFHGPLRFVTYHSRFALTSMRNRKSLRRRQAVDNYD